MYITEMIAELQLIKAQYGDIQIMVNNQQSFKVTLSVVDELDPKTLQPIEKMVQAE